MKDWTNISNNIKQGKYKESDLKTENVIYLCDEAGNKKMVNLHVAYADYFKNQNI